VGRTYKLARRLRVCGPWTVLLTGRPVGWDTIVGGEFLLLRKLQDLPSIPEGGGDKATGCVAYDSFLSVRTLRMGGAYDLQFSEFPVRCAKPIQIPFLNQFTANASQ